MYKSPPYLPSFESIGCSVQEKELKIYYQDGSCGSQHGFLIQTILAISVVQVILILPTKFCVKWPFRSEEEDQNIGSRWRQWWLSWSSDPNKFSYFLSTCHPDIFYQVSGWSGGAKVLCILHHWGVQLILAYSWARPAILVVGKGRGGMFLFLLFLHFHSCSSFFPVPLFHLLYSLFYLFSPFLWETTQNDPQGLTCR